MLVNLNTTENPRQEVYFEKRKISNYSKAEYAYLGNSGKAKKSVKSAEMSEMFPFV